MDTIVVPIINDKKGNITELDNYRPITITYNFSKILELLILERYSDHLQRSH